VSFLFTIAVTVLRAMVKFFVVFKVMISCIVALASYASALKPEARAFAGSNLTNSIAETIR